MRICPRLATRPRVGLSKPASRLRRVVLPHPDGPTMATNSPTSTSSEKSFRTSVAPKEREIDSRLSSLSLIAPTYARHLGQLQKESINQDAYKTYDDHVDDQQVHAQTVARIPDGETETVLPCDHLCGDDDHPGESGSDAKGRDDLRRNRG